MKNWLDAEDDDAGRSDPYQGGPCFVGVDIAARNDVTVIRIVDAVGDVLLTRALIERGPS